MEVFRGCPRLFYVIYGIAGGWLGTGGCIPTAVSLVPVWTPCVGWQPVLVEV